MKELQSSSQWSFVDIKLKDLPRRRRRREHRWQRTYEGHVTLRDQVLQFDTVGTNTCCMM